MNKYLRAVGFTDLPRRKEIYSIIENGIIRPVYRAYTTNEDDEDSLLAQFDIEMGESFGISVCGQFDDQDQFYPDYYYPYLDSTTISSTEELSVESRVDNDSYAGICDEGRVGAALIFRLRNTVEYIKNCHMSFLPLENTSVTLTALSLQGTVILPIYKSPEEARQMKASELKRRRMLNAARSGDEEAMRNIAADEINLYTNLMYLLPDQDIYSLVENYLIPYGTECELYSVMGEIEACEKRVNQYTEETIYILKIKCSGLPMDIAINEKDLSGEPQAGRRFKGIIWLQGKINFPITTELPELNVRKETSI